MTVYNKVMNSPTPTYLIANWKMNLSLKASLSLAKKVTRFDTQLRDKNIELILCPSFTALEEVGKILGDTNIKLGAQDVFYADKGAYTGEISPNMLRELNCQYVILGHSEQRKFDHETDEEINKKVKTVLEHEMTPIICVGENLEQKQQGQTDLIVMRQVDRALQSIQAGPDTQIVIAYEPVWAISPAKPDDPGETQHIAHVIHQLILDLYSLEAVEKNFSVIYGGSVDANNIQDFLVPGLIDGVLVGSASQKEETFVAIIDKLVSQNS